MENAELKRERNERKEDRKSVLFTCQVFCRRQCGEKQKATGAQETWILVAGLRLTHWMTLDNPHRFLDLDFPTALERGCKR